MTGWAGDGQQPNAAEQGWLSARPKSEILTEVLPSINSLKVVPEVGPRRRKSNQMSCSPKYKDAKMLQVTHAVLRIDISIANLARATSATSSSVRPVLSFLLANKHSSRKQLLFPHSYRG